MSDIITLESLIKEHKSLIAILQYGKDKYYYQNQQNYEKWLARTRRYLSIHFTNDKQTLEFDSISRNQLSRVQQEKMLAILEALTLLPEVIPTAQFDTQNNIKDKMSITINNTNSQSQNQEQSIAVQLFIEAIKDDLTGRQIKELKAVVEDADNDLKKARPKIINKLKDFGIDVVSNIVTNIISNPEIWKGLL